MSDPDSALRDYLAVHEEPCPSCGYNLHGLQSNRCPECGQALVLRVNLQEPRLGALLGALSGLLAGVGAAVVCLLIVTYVSLRWGPPNSGAFVPVFVIPTVMVLVEGGLALALGRTKGRVWFRKLDRSGRAFVISCAWLLLLAFVAWFVVIVK